jgi:multisubunit Na+/H+ antiporter MnhE subunit
MNLSLVLILALSLIWCLINGEFSLRTWGAGLIIGALIILFTGWGRENRIPWRELPRRTAYLLWLFTLLLPYNIVKANFGIAGRLLRRTPDVNPAIVAIPAGDLTESALGVEEQIITVAPGQLVVDYSADEEVIYVHLIDRKDYDEKGEKAVTWMYDILKRILT